MTLGKWNALLKGFDHMHYQDTCLNRPRASIGVMTPAYQGTWHGTYQAATMTLDRVPLIKEKEKRKNQKRR